MYSEIEKLKRSLEQFTIQISEPNKYIREDLFFVTVTIREKSWNVLVDDEFLDFKKGNQVLRWFLVLFALDLYKDAEDILVWSREHNINPHDFLEYYKELSVIYSQLENLIGDLDPQISDFDYSLCAGAYQELTRNTRSH